MAVSETDSSLASATRGTALGLATVIRRMATARSAILPMVMASASGFPTSAMAWRAWPTRAMATGQAALVMVVTLAGATGQEVMGGTECFRRRAVRRGTAIPAMAAAHR